MKTVFATRTTLVWALLVVITILSWSLGASIGFRGARNAGFTILILGFVKVRLVLREFMELRQAPAAIRRLADAWLLGTCAVLLLLYASGTPH